MEDAVLYWNAVALEANKVSHTDGSKEQNGPTLSSRALAMIHLAIYDAFQGLTGGSTYLPVVPSIGPTSVDAAIASAAHAVLFSLYPSQRVFFDRKYETFIPTGSSEEIHNGHTYGHIIAKNILKDRKDDILAGDEGYNPILTECMHRVDPDNPTQGFHGPNYGENRLFAVSILHELDAPPRCGGKKYSAALRQVRSKGIASELMGTLPNTIVPAKRTVDETLIGIYWGYDGAKKLGTPPRLYNQIVREIAINQNNTLAQNVLLFARVNTSMADAGI